ncbi:MAG: peptide-methionine (R)-S-oxide reductase MsrB [Candidatus Lokiarchaeota archaeon]|nr:peptide-methionine (R)-S-oxide reductase MsrB [Candidatus Lokiarchaeota archaeon]
MASKINKSDKDWKKELTKEQFKVLRKKGTEPPFTGKYLDNKKKGVYRCAGCGAPLFSSESKFESGTGWPSFYETMDNNNVAYENDKSLGMDRTEVHCNKCGGHLGHVFDDGPRPTGKRYCINSISLDFESDE